MQRLAIFALTAVVLTLANPARSQTFEVASVRPHEGPLTRMKDLTVSGTLVKLEGYSVLMLVMEAYHVRNYQVSVAASAGAEDDIRGKMYDIVARAPGERIPAQRDLETMLRNLLADRFGLLVHRGKKEMTVYGLVSATNAPKLKPSAAATPCSIHVNVVRNGRIYDETFANCSMENLAEQIGNVGMDRPVLDRTGLTRGYDFNLVFTPDATLRNGSEPGDIDLFSALRALGLRLETQKAPIETITIDRVRAPTAN